MKNYFKESEFSCKCGCGLNNVNEQLKEDLNIARHIAKTPFVVTSGSRCESHNKRIGSIRSSAHITGNAVDIKADNSRDRYLILKGLLMAGFTRIGINKNFIHVDNDRTKPDQVSWLYK